jgi:hypothetical protein
MNEYELESDFARFEKECEWQFMRVLCKKFQWGYYDFRELYDEMKGAIEKDFRDFSYSERIPVVGYVDIDEIVALGKKVETDYLRYSVLEAERRSEDENFELNNRVSSFVYLSKMEKVQVRLYYTYIAKRAIYGAIKCAVEFVERG